MGQQYLNDTDIWSLGLSLMECAIGKFPYDVSKKRQLWDMISMLNDGAVPELPEEFSPEFKDFVKIWYDGGMILIFYVFFYIWELLWHLILF